VSWAAPHVASLQHGRHVQFRPRGGSMAGRVESGQLVTVAPLPPHATPQPGQVVLCKVKGNYYLHLVKQVRADGGCLIGNNRGGVNGWTSRRNVYGVLTKVEP